MKLSQKRILFTALLAEFLIWAKSEGKQVALDQVKRTDAEAKANAASGAGIANSLHTKGLAADVLLYSDTGAYLTDSKDYKELGEKWKTMHPLARWGGDFKRVDGNHFSLEHEGVK